MRCVAFAAAVALAGQVCPAQSSPADPVRAVSILESRCGQCHSEKVSMSGFRISTRDAMLKGGTRGPALVAGDPDKSLLIAAIEHNGKLAMPPGPKLPDADIQILRAWVRDSAPWPDASARRAASDWWAFQKPVRPDVPPGSKSPIDAFISSKLTES